MIVYADDVILLAPNYRELQQMYDMLQDNFANIGLQFDPGKTTWLSLAGTTPTGDQVPQFLEKMTWLGIIWQKGDYKFDSTAQRRKRLAEIAQMELIGDVKAAQLQGRLASCRVLWIAMVMSHLGTMAPAWGMQHFRVRDAWNHTGIKMLAQYLRNILGLSNRASLVALASEAGLWPPVVLVAKRLDAMWDTARDSGNALLRAAVECETSLCQAGRKCWLKNWLQVLRCELGDIVAGQLGDKVEEACVRELDKYRNAPIHADVCTKRHVSMYVQQFSVVTSPGKVPRHHHRFQLPLRVTRQYIRIATGDITLPAYRIPHDTPFTQRACPYCLADGGSAHVCTVYHLMSECPAIRAHFRVLEDDAELYTPDLRGQSMQDWLQNNYSADGITYLVDAVRYFETEVLPDLP